MNGAVEIDPKVAITRLEDRISALESWLDFVTHRLNDTLSKLRDCEKEKKEK